MWSVVQTKHKLVVVEVYGERLVMVVRTTEDKLS